MATDLMCSTLRRLRGATMARAGDRDDGALLADFLGGDQSAFEALVRRHGPMVLGVCRRLLGHRQDAEDAFQATFLVLARRAASLDRGGPLGNWLYGVAYRTSLKARAAAARRRRREQQVLDMPHPHTEAHDGAAELRPLLDRELHALPEKYRAAVVLCELQGVPRREAARRLRLAEGTLSSRLAAARKLLARRLARRGVEATAVALAACLRPESAAASLPPGLIAATVQAAAPAAAIISPNVSALTEGVLRSMLLGKLKLVTALVVMAGALCGVAALATRDVQAAPAVVAPDGQERPAAPRQEKERPKDKNGDKKEGERPRDGETLRRIVAAVNPAANTITLEQRRDGGQPAEKTIYQVAKDCKIFIDEQPAKLEKLRSGDQVLVTLSANKMEVVRINLAGKTTQAVLKSVDAKARTVTLGGRPREDGTVTDDRVLKVGAGAKIFVDGKAVDLAAVQPNVRTQLRLSLDGNSVVGITQGRGKEREKE